MDREVFFDKLCDWARKLKEGDKELHFACTKFLYCVMYEKDKYALDNDELSNIFDKIGYPSLQIENWEVKI